MKEKIQRLTELQEIDLRIKGVEAEMAKGPAELEARRTRLEERRQAVEALKERGEAIARRKRELEAETADELERIRDRQGKLMRVQTNREHQSLLKEIEDAKKANRGREEEVLGLMDEAERLAASLTEEESHCAEEEALLGQDETRVQEELAALAVRKADLAEERGRKQDEVSRELLSKYEMLRHRRNGMATVPVVRGVCQGCFMNLPPQLFNQLMRATALIACPNCQRIIYYQDPAADQA
ncbi:MAG: C4-type zinc ribbon domain-containing protein [Thermodesulfobacteriota bacterium]